MIVNDNTKYGVCVWIYIRAVYSIYTYMHIQYVVGCILSSDSCKIWLALDLQEPNCCVRMGVSLYGLCCVVLCCVVCRMVFAI
jgi:hypothetical protein